MSEFSGPDQPMFDTIGFEKAALARANQFVTGVRRLGLFEPDFSSPPYIVSKGATYQIPGGNKIEVLHEIYDQNPGHVLARARITNPPIKIAGSDGQLRKVSVARYVQYKSFKDPTPIIPGDPLPVLSDEQVAVNERIEAMLKPLRDQYESNKLELYANPSYRPPELIQATTLSTVECKLPFSPNYRTERYSAHMPIDTRLAHLAARRRAGENPGQLEYTVAEHKSLISQLAEIKKTSVSSHNQSTTTLKANG